ncbi:reverse transcriptase domain-containing protein [Tanacetum coccineum]
MNALEKLTCRRTCQVRSHHQNSEEAGMSKDISGSELLAPSLCSGDEGLSSGGTKLILIFITAEVILPSPSSQRKFTSTFGAIRETRHPIYPKKKTEEGMVHSQPMEEEFWGAVTRDMGTKTHGGPTEPVLQTQKTPSPSPAFIKENIDVLRTMIKEHDQQAKMKATPRKLAYVDSDKEAPAGSRRLKDRSITKEKAKRERSKPKGKRFGHQETSSDSEHEEGSEDIYEDLSSPYKRPKPTPFTQRITRFKYHRRTKLPQNIRVYKGNKDLEDHLGGAAQNWFDNLDPKSVDSFEELSQKFLEEFSQQKSLRLKRIELLELKKHAELSAIEKIQADYDMKATNIILQGLLADIYSLVNHHRVAKDLWERV